ncbi:MAG: electron transport complex subunit C [Candidatus Hydrogenedentota bacterium]
MRNAWLQIKKTFPHGIHPPELKDLTKDKPIRRFPFAPEMIIPLSQHTGAPAKPIVREGQEVVRGEPIADAGGFVSVPMHAPATGRIARIGLCRDTRGGMTPAVFLKVYPSASQEILYGSEVDVDALPPKDLVKAVQDTGVVGLGGAAFPTHVKLVLPEGRSVDTIVVNGCECEPYLTTDHRVMLEYPEAIMQGIRVVLRALSAKQAVIGVEKNKMDAIARLQRFVPGDLPIEVRAVETKYPQGAEKMLVKALLGRNIPSGGLPYEVHVGVFNVATLAQIGELLPRKQGLIERVVTVTGPGVKEPGNYLLPIGTPLEYVLDRVGLTAEPDEIIFGGPMMGASIVSREVPITKGITGIVVFPRGQGSRNGHSTEYPCIRCGQCVDACPMHLNPSTLGLLARNRVYDEMVDRYHLMDCFECGCCAYVCPSAIPLVHHFRVAKSFARERKAKS